VRFYLRVREDEFDKLLFDDLIFYMNTLQSKKNESYKNSLMCASFTAWQMLCAQTELKLDWSAYLSKLGLVEIEKRSKAQVERDVKRAKDSVQRIVEKAKKG